jgi:Zn-dependent M32 family carboxypeptidase
MHNVCQHFIASRVAARKANDWSTFGPILSEVVELKKAITAATRPDMTAYNGNIDQFERGMTQDRLTEVYTHVPLCCDTL